MILELKEADRETFSVFANSIYARDKKHIFDSRHGIVEQADLESFHVVHVELENEIMKFGKDKDNYFFWNTIITDTVGFGVNIRERIEAK